MALFVIRIIRSASPSSAMPTSARISRTYAPKPQVRSADLQIDVEPVRLDADLDHFGAEFHKASGATL